MALKSGATSTCVDNLIYYTSIGVEYFVNIAWMIDGDFKTWKLVFARA